MLPRVSLAVAVTIGFIVGLSCSEKRSTSSGDTIPPDAISDLSVVDTTSHSVTLRWTASGDDGGEGTAARYDIRWARSEVTFANWDSARTVIADISLEESGARQSFTIDSLLPETNYFFCLRVADDAENWSALSNIVSVTTHAVVDTFPPIAIIDLVAADPTDQSIRLSWTAPADSVTGSRLTRYEIRYDETAISEESWNSAVQVPDVPDPAQPGSEESIIVDGLAAGTLYYFALKSEDSAAHESATSNMVSQFTSNPGGTTWQRVIGGTLDERGSAIAVAPGGGYGLLGTSEISVYFGRLDASGAVRWEDRIAAYNTSVEGIAAGADGSFMIIATRDECDIRLLRVVGTGDHLWTTAFGGAPGLEKRASDIITAHESGYLIGGSYDAGFSHLVAKINNAGDIMWQRTYRGDGWIHGGSELTRTEDGGYIVCGDDHGKPHLIKIDPPGEVMWEIKVTGSINIWPKEIIVLGDGYLVGGYGYESTETITDGYLLRTDLDGNIVWEVVPGGSECNYLASAVAMANGDFLAVGKCHDDVYLVRVDDDGDVIWERTFGGDGIDSGSDIIATPDGGFLIVGTTRSFGAGGSDIYLIKLDANGEL